MPGYLIHPEGSLPPVLKTSEGYLPGCKPKQRRRRVTRLWQCWVKTRTERNRRTGTAEHTSTQTALNMRPNFFIFYLSSDPFRRTSGRARNDMLNCCLFIAFLPRCSRCRWRYASCHKPLFNALCPMQISTAAACAKNRQCPSLNGTGWAAGYFNREVSSSASRIGLIR